MYITDRKYILTELGKENLHLLLITYQYNKLKVLALTK